jgi:invasion protein IalB
LVSNRLALAALVAVALLLVVGGGIYLFGGWLGLTGGADPAAPATSVSLPPAVPSAVPSASPPAAPVPQPVAELFEKWRVQCAQDAQSRQRCRADQVVVGQNGVPQLAIYATPPLAGRAAQALIVPPWGILIDRGLSLQIDAQSRFTVPIVSCQPSGCWAEFPLDDTLLGAMRQGTTLQVAMVGANGEPVVVAVPLAGFAAAYDRLLQKNGG